MRFCVLVPPTGLEPVRFCGRGILSPLCLPFHHGGAPNYKAIITKPTEVYKCFIPNCHIVDFILKKHDKSCRLCYTLICENLSSNKFLIYKEVS